MKVKTSVLIPALKIDKKDICVELFMINLDVVVVKLFFP